MSCTQEFCLLAERGGSPTRRGPASHRPEATQRAGARALFPGPGRAVGWASLPVNGFAGLRWGWDSGGSPRRGDQFSRLQGGSQLGRKGACDTAS